MRTFLLVACAVTGAAAAWAKPDVALAVCGTASDCSIVLPAEPGPSTVFAAEELQRYAERLTGVRLPIVRRGEKFVGRPIVLTETDAYGTDGFRLQAGKKESFQIAGGRRGILYGVYEVLETYGGCGWFASWHEVVPKIGRLAVPADLDVVQKPAFAMRLPTWQDVREDVAFAARLRVNGHACDGAPDQPLEHGGVPISFVRGLGNCHTFGRVLPPKTYFKDHPEWFSEVDGVRRDGRTQICLTNPEAFEQAFSNVCAFIDKDLAARKTADAERVADALIAGVSQGDWHNYCTCAACKAIDDREESHAGTLLHFINRMADRLAARYPGLKTETLIYQYTRKAPKTMRPSENVIPCLCSIECSFAHPLAMRDNRANAAFMDDLEKWGGLSRNLYVWDYTMRPHYYFHPFPNVHVFAPNLRTFRDNGVKYVFAQGGPRYGEFAQLKGWMLAKLMWDPDQPIEPLLDRFFAGHYGAAAPFVRAYFERFERILSEKKDIQYRIWENDRPDLFPDELIDWAREQFKQAAAAVQGDPVLSKNVRIAAFTPVCVRLNRRAAETKRIWVTRDPSKFRDCADVQDDIRLAFDLAAELNPKTGRLKMSESFERSARVWKSWDLMRNFVRPVSGTNSVLLGARELGRTYCEFGGIEKNADCFRGECVKVFNTQDYYAAVSLDFGNVAFDADAEYVLRFRAKADPVPNGTGEAFNVEFAGQRIAPSVEEIGADWKWYNFKPIRLKDGHCFEFKSGRFKNGGGRGAVRATFVDQVEITRQ